MKKLKGTVLVVISAISFGFLPIFARFSYLEGVTVNQFLFLRFLIASILFIIYLNFKKDFNIPSYRNFLYFVLLGGILYFSQSNLYLNSIIFIPISVAVLILYTYPVFVAIFSSIFYKEKLNKRIIIALILALIGLYLITNPIFSLSILGILLPLSASLVYTVYILISAKIIIKYNEEVASFYIILSSSFSFLLSILFFGNLNFYFNLKAWIWILVVALISTSLAITTFLQGIKLIGPTLSSLISLIEPITSIVSSFIIFRESFFYLQWIGVVAIFVAIIISLK